MRHLLGFGAALTVFVAGCLTAQATTKFQVGDAASSEPLVWNFDSEPADAISFVGAVFSGTWEVRSEADSPSPPNALCQTGKAQYPGLSLGEWVFSDVVLTARFKPIAGREDQAAGLLFRIQDQDNYYILRANALENNVNFYKYAGGRRGSLKEAKGQVSAGTWQELRVEAVGNRFRGFLNGQQVVEVADDTYQAGMVGLWTKADSVTCFDDVEARSP